MKRKEEQDEKLMAHKTYQAKLTKQKVAAQKTIDGQMQNLEKLNASIIQAKEDQEKANNEKNLLDNKTQTLQQEKDHEGVEIEKKTIEKEEQREL